MIADQHGTGDQPLPVERGHVRGRAMNEDLLTPTHLPHADVVRAVDESGQFHNDTELALKGVHEAR